MFNQSNMLLGLQRKNQELLREAFIEENSLIIDVAQCINPYALEEFYESFERVYVIEVELLYKFKKVIEQLETLIQKYALKKIIITNYKHLFDYNNKVEKEHILTHIWLRMKELSTQIQIVVGISSATQKKYAQTYCDIIR